MYDSSAIHGLLIILFGTAFFFFFWWYIMMKLSGAPSPVKSLVLSVIPSRPVPAQSAPASLHEEVYSNDEIKALLIELLEERRHGKVPGDITSGRFVIRESASGGVFIKANDQAQRKVVRETTRVLKRFAELEDDVKRLRKAISPELQTLPAPVKRVKKSLPAGDFSSRNVILEQDEVLVVENCEIPAKFVPLVKDALKVLKTKQEREILMGLIFGFNEEDCNRWLSAQSELPQWVITHLDTDLLYLCQYVYKTDVLPLEFQKNLNYFRLLGQEINRIQERSFQGPIMPQSSKKVAA